jgi:glycosyltransferase involved in cell wall biosynthesis
MSNARLSLKPETSGAFDAARARRHLPEAIFRPGIEAKARPTLIATGYIHTIRTAFSGSSYYLAEAGMKAGLVDGIIAAQSDIKNDLGLKARAALWKAGKKAQGLKVGGYKFARDFQDKIWRDNLKYLAGCDIIDNCQTRGRYFNDACDALDIRSYCYIDGTLKEYFSTYGEFDCINIDETTRSEAIEDEAYGYQKARHIVAMSQRTRTSLIEDYGVPAQKISVVVPGANIDDDLVDLGTTNRAPSPDEDFILGFVGLYPARKGLDRLAAAMTILRGRGRKVRLRAVGNCPEDIQTMDGVDYYGIIRKSAEPERFAQVVSGVHLGCQLSWAELTGIAMMEFLRFGIPVLATDTGGMPDIVAGGGGELVARDIAPEALADALDAIITDRSRYATLAKGAQSQAGWASWTRTAAEIDQALRSH